MTIYYYLVIRNNRCKPLKFKQRAGSVRSMAHRFGLDWQCCYLINKEEYYEACDLYREGKLTIKWARSVIF